MIWLNPLALIGVAAIAAPILIHILVQRRAAPFPFPTLRFLQPTRLAAIRRHRVEDLLLLAARAAILAAAAGALAGPFLVTPARRAGWNSRIARAIVGEGEAARAVQRTDLQPFRVQVFETGDLRDGIARAVVWLDASPPARREIVVVAPFTLGSLTRVDLGDVPPEVGIRLVRSGELPATRSFAAPPVLDAGLAPFRVRRRTRTVDLNGPSTAVREDASAPASVPVEIVASAEVKRAAEATLAAVLSQRVTAPVPGRFARLVFGSPTASAEDVRVAVRGARRPSAGPPAPGGPSPASRAPAMPPWVADAIDRVTTEPLLGIFGLDLASLSGAATGAPVVSAVGGLDGQTLVVTTSLPPADLRTALLFRSVLRALGARDGQSTPGFAESFVGSATTAERGPQPFAAQEILAIPDADLRAWERPAGGVRSPRLDTLERDDRRWWWAAVLALLALEGWLRRSRRERAEDTGDVEAARVA